MPAEIEYRYFLRDLIQKQSPLLKFVKNLAQNAPPEVQKILVYSVYWDKSEWGFWYKKRRRFCDNHLRKWRGQRRPIQPKIKKEKGTIRVFYTAENCEINMNYADYAFGFSQPSEVDHHHSYFQLPYFAYQGDLTGLTAQDRIAYLAHLPEKDSFCDFVYNHHVKKREALFDHIHAYKAVAAPSRSRHNAPSIGSGLSVSESRNVIDWHQARIDYGKRFRFSIACENEAYPGYITEKIISAYKAGSIPIYYGAPDIAEYFNPRSFLNANTLSPAALLHQIETLERSEEARKRLLQEPPILSKETAAFFSPPVR